MYTKGTFARENLSTWMKAKKKCKQHHELLMVGYPMGLKNDEICRCKVARYP